jgi:hypothetical protein
VLPDKTFWAILDFPVDGKANIRGDAAVRLFEFGIAARILNRNRRVAKASVSYEAACCP